MFNFIQNPSLNVSFHTSFNYLKIARMFQGERGTVPEVSLSCVSLLPKGGQHNVHTEELTVLDINLTGRPGISPQSVEGSR